MRPCSRSACTADETTRSTRWPARSTSSSRTARATTTTSPRSPTPCRGVLAAAAPDLVIYLAGADSHEGDRLGRLCLTFDGLARRDVMVLDACREVGIPVAITIAGGYGRNIEDSVQRASQYGADRERIL